MSSSLGCSNLSLLLALNLGALQCSRGSRDDDLTTLFIDISTETKTFCYLINLL